MTSIDVYYLTPEGDIKKMRGRQDGHPHLVVVEGFPFHLHHQGKQWFRDEETAYQAALERCYERTQKLESQLQEELARMDRICAHLDSL